MPKTQNIKEQSRDALVRKLWLPKNIRAIILIDISDTITREFIISACDVLGVAHVEALDKEDIAGYDAVITDGAGDLDLVSLIQLSVVPIIPRTHALIGSFREFDPMKFEGNAFIYESVNPYLVFEKLVRYLENVRYAGDKRTLLNNLNKTF